MANEVEVTFYRTPTGRRMVMCPCRIKVRVLIDGTLADHWAYDEEYQDGHSSTGDRCVFRHWVFTEKAGTVFGMEFGFITPPAEELRHDNQVS